jgi:hypothetical protein
MSVGFLYLMNRGSTALSPKSAGRSNSPLPQEGEINAGTAWRTRGFEFKIHRRSGANGKNYLARRPGANRQSAESSSARLGK